MSAGHVPGARLDRDAGTSADETTIAVPAPRPYDVVVGRGLLHRLEDLVGTEALRVAVVHAPPLRQIARQLTDLLPGRQTHPIEVPDGEAAKSLQVAGSCWSALGTAGFTRSDVVIGVGGGAVTDLAGFVAAAWLRGVPVVHVPTTVLGMVDAAIGGKSAINTAAGKNLVGAFHDPSGVLCDLDLLSGLPGAEIVSGLAEVVKCGFVADPTILDDVEAAPESAVEPSSSLLRTLVERAIRVKVNVVSADPYETHGAVGREVLNYGHTLGHAVEKVEGFRRRHGEAVSIGLVYVAELARAAGRLDDETADRHAAVLGRLGLPTGYRADAWPDLLAAMRVDKKARADRLRFIVLDGLARPGALDAPDEKLLTAAYRALTARGR